MIIFRVALMCLIFLLSLSSSTEAGGLGKVIGKSVIKKIMKADSIRDRKTVIKTLRKPRTVFRYTSRTRAKEENKYGLVPGKHMTASGGRGRPLSAQAAQKRYGLPAKPEIRETIRLDAGFAVKHNKVLGGAPGYGELTSPKRIQPSSIQRIIPLRNAH